MMEVEINDKKGTHRYKRVYKIEAIENYIIVYRCKEKDVVWNVDDINSWNVNFLVNPEPEREVIDDG